MTRPFRKPDDESPERSGFLCYGPRGLVWIDHTTAPKPGKLPVMHVSWHEKRGSEMAEPTVRIEGLVAARAAAQKARNWVDADRIGVQLTELGVSFEDTEGGTKWWLKR